MMDQDNPVAKPPEASVMDWDLCALCQQASTAALICPAKRNGDGYKYIAENLKGFITENVQKCAAQLSDSRILSKLAAGDMVAQDAVYHSLCLKDYYRRTKKRQAMEKREEKGFSHNSIALTELVSYIESCRDDIKRPLFKMIDLHER